MVTSYNGKPAKFLGDMVMCGKAGDAPGHKTLCVIICINLLSVTLKA